MLHAFVSITIALVLLCSILPFKVAGNNDSGYPSLESELFEFLYYELLLILNFVFGEDLLLSRDH